MNAKVKDGSLLSEKAELKMEYHLKESPRMKQNKKEEKKWLEYYKKHKKKINEMKPTLSSSKQNENYDYLHVQLRLKKLQMEEDRFAKIDYENRKLLERIMKVVGDIPVTSRKQNEGTSLNRRARSMETERIERENKKFQERLDLAKAKSQSHSATTIHDNTAMPRARQRMIEEKHIMEENLKLQGRLDQARPVISSAPADYMIQTREKQRQNDERKFKEENKLLKERIDAARHRLNLTPPKANRPHASFEDRFETEARTIEKQNLKLQERLEKILHTEPHVKAESNEQVKRRPRMQRSFSEDNKFMQRRLETIKSTIDAGRRDQRQQSQIYRTQARVVEEEKIIQQNLSMQQRISKIMGSPKRKAPKKVPDSKDHSKRRQLDELQKSIEKENKLLSERIRNVRPVMSTRNQGQSTIFVPYNDHYEEENKLLRTRIAKIRRGKDPGPLRQNTELGEEQEEVQQQVKKKEKKKAKGKKYQVPEGYHKKFRKRKKKNQKQDDDDDDDSDLETETDTD